MKKRLCVILSAVLLTVLFGACSPAGSGGGKENLAFPDTTWEMNMDEVMAVYGVTAEETQACSEAGRGPAFTLGDREVFGQKAQSVAFSFVNLKLDESRDLQSFDEESMGGQEVLAQVWVMYPAGTDMTKVAEELDKLYGGSSLSEVTLYPLYNALDTGELQEKKEQASDTLKIWGTDTVGTAIGEEDAGFFRENWPIYQTGMKAEDWDDFSQNARFVTVLCVDDESAPYVQFDAYNLAVYEELKAQLGAA